ncbi:MAG: hypothetical protein AAF387_15565 [Pseudomonadota bacterium]
MADFGILSFGAYVPPIRIPRQAIADGIGWAVPGIKGLAKGERAVANWDEDCITMAVEAARDCLKELSVTPDSLQLASTTLPFHDRSNSGIVADALGLPKTTRTEDGGGSRRAGSSALVRLANNDQTSSLLIASDCRDTKPGSVQEMQYGHAAAAVLVGEGEPIAIIKGAASFHEDLVDQYRGADTDYDYVLEERWVREEGYFKIVPAAISDALEQAQIDIGEIHRIVLPATSGTIRGLAKKLKVDGNLFADPLNATCGDSGAAHPLLMLASSLEAAVPGEKILVLGFGQGADAIVLETTPALEKLQHSRGPSHYLAERRLKDNYTFFLSVRDQIAVDFGLRSERDNRTAMSAAYRRRDDISGMNGGRCTKCNTLQFPRSLICVSCGAEKSQEPESLSGLVGTVKSFTEDWLAYTPVPPLIYGNVEYQDGANIMLEFTDFEAGQVKSGEQVRMVFRIKDYDYKRGFRRYFWKPAPLPGVNAS